MKKGLFLTFSEKRCISSHPASVAQVGCEVSANFFILLHPLTVYEKMVTSSSQPGKNQ
jgi:hypothetical protein